MNNSEQLEAIEAVRMVAPSDLVLTPCDYGRFAVEIEYGCISEIVTLEGYNKLYCVKQIMDSEPVKAALE